MKCENIFLRNIYRTLFNPKSPELLEQLLQLVQNIPENRLLVYLDEAKVLKRPNNFLLTQDITNLLMEVLWCGYAAAEDGRQVFKITAKMDAYNGNIEENDGEKCLISIVNNYW
uniref:Uncharacterized protein n=1 Tax=Strigamia maritima TaxID=126957 RepID=T1JAN6_STRMM